MIKKMALNVAFAVAIGLGLRFVVNLEPVWWLAWIMPGLLLALALRADEWRARGLVAAAALIGVSANVTYYLKVMPPLMVIFITALQVLLWIFTIGIARRVIRAFESVWTVLALPVIGVAADTLLAHFTPDGNWGSLAYTQVDVLALAQIASVFGVGGILFLILLVNSALALAIHQPRSIHDAWPMPAAVIAIVTAAAVFGWSRLQTPVQGSPISYGIVSIDDFISGPETDHSRDVWRQYDAQVTMLASAGARLVLLPEKIDVLSVEDAEARKAHLSKLAAASRVWLVAGLGVDKGRERRNEAWWFAPDGRLATNYLKHFLAPPERNFIAGSEYPVNAVEGVNHAVAICKDMHFASLARAFAARDAAVMLVPAWDWRDDAWMAANMTRLRGVENGYAVVRASREGLLSVSDAYGRMLSVAQSASFPGASLFATVKVGHRIPTIYTRTGDVLGWLCVGCAMFAIGAVSRRARRAKQGVSPNGVPRGA